MVEARKTEYLFLKRAILEEIVKRKLNFINYYHPEESLGEVGKDTKLRDTLRELEGNGALSFNLDYVVKRGWWIFKHRGAYVVRTGRCEELYKSLSGRQ